MISTSYEVALLILSVEFAIVATFILFSSFRRVKTSEAQTTSEASELVSKVVDSEDSRRQALETVFKNKYNYDGDDLAGAVDEFMQREKAFYNAVVGAVLGRGDAKLSDINDELTKVVAPWISITPKNMVDAKSAEALESEKGRLEVELGETKDTLEKMLTEYSRAFNVDEPLVEDETAPSDATPQADAETQEAPDEELDEELDYQTEELHDLDEILASKAFAKTAGEEPNDVEVEALSDDDVKPVDDDNAIVDLTDTGEDSLASDDAEANRDESPEDASEGLEELDSLDSFDDDQHDGEDTLGKPMTADDLDELMGSLDAEDETADTAEAV